VRDRDAPGEVPGSFKVTEIAPTVFLDYYQQQIEIAAGETNGDCENDRGRRKERDGIASQSEVRHCADLKPIVGSARSGMEESSLSSERRSHCG
jgi:hypothetical protein